MSAGARGTAVVVVNYRTPALTVATVESVLAEDDVVEVVVVDSASDDGSVESLRRAMTDDCVRLVEAPANKGFGAGVNLGVADCHAPFALILNSDATLRPGSLGVLVSALVADDTLAVLAPAVMGPDGRTPQAAVFGSLPRRRDLLLPGPRALLGNGAAEDDARPGWVSGVAMLVRMADFRAVGGFDEDFEMYFEDVDLCRRLREGGRSVGRLLAATVVHAGGASWRSGRDKKRQYYRSKATYSTALGGSSVERGIIAATGRIRSLLPVRR